MSLGSGSDRKGAKTGDEWKYMIHFDPEAEKTTGRGYDIADDELIAKLSELVDAGETIIKVEAFKSPLTQVQLTKAVWYHEFIVFRTNRFYWSIEKQKDGITIQRSKNKDAVKNRHRKADRTEGLSGITSMKSARGRKSINDLIQWLYRSRELNQPYHWFDSNCQEFAEKVYNFMT